MDQINFFNDCSPQTLLVLPFLNTLFHILIAFWESNSHLEFGKFDSMQNITSETLSVWTKMFLGKSASFLQNIFSHINITVNQKWGTISMLWEINSEAIGKFCLEKEVQTFPNVNFYVNEQKLTFCYYLGSCIFTILFIYSLHYSNSVTIPAVLSLMCQANKG